MSFFIQGRQPNLLRELQRELFPLMSQFTCESTPLPEQDLNAWAPKVDIKEEEKEYVVYADIPGVDPKEIEIEMDGNTLTVKGERKVHKEEKGKNYYRSERTMGKFYRQFTLPESVDSTKINAKTKLGVLAIHIPKALEGKGHRKIVVQHEETE